MATTPTLVSSPNAPSPPSTLALTSFHTDRNPVGAQSRARGRFASIVCTASRKSCTPSAMETTFATKTYETKSERSGRRGRNIGRE
jgi:hypothetical protein